MKDVKERLLKLIEVTKERVRQGSSAAGCFAAMRTEIEQLCDTPEQSKLTGCVSRDEDGSLWLYWLWPDGQGKSYIATLPESDFLSVKHGHDKEVEIIIKLQRNDNRELAKRRAWAETHFGDKNLTDEELATAAYMPSENFSDGWDKGSEYALSHQWIPVDERLPEPDTMCLVFGYRDFGDGNLTRYTMMAWYDGEDFSDAYDDRKYRPDKWMAIPLVPIQLNPEKE